MKCPKCQFEIPEGSNFCLKCGCKLELHCPQCGNTLPPVAEFCNKCGHDLQFPKQAFDEISESESPSLHHNAEKPSSDRAPIEGERKHVTVLFSDLTGYTVMSEKLDPEEVKEITSQIFGEISKIVNKYDGFIEKYAGDAVMALFGVPKAHEDDSIRAIKVAREIHELVDEISPELESRIGQPISMHTGINSGLVVTGEVNVERGTHGIAGDTINIASRLSNLAKPGEILIDVDTCRRVEGHFTCEFLEEATVKGKADSVQVHKVLSPKDKPVTIHRLSGLRADLVGRKVELAELSEAVENLQKSRGRIFSISGAAGTGKSRLVEEFKATLDLKKIQWIEGHAYAYSQNIPYFPMIDLLNQVLHIEENDPPEKVREKIESGLKHLVGKPEEVAPYIGGLYSLSYPEIKKVSPEFWKSRLQSAVKAILSALANRSPTIYFLEDLHWADPSFVELLRRACLEIREPAIVLCVYRPSFSLFREHELSGVGKYYHEIQLQDLSRSETQDMLESLLKTSDIPSDLRRFVQSKAEGNPFYLEELVNSLIESETLIRDNGHWIITKSISEGEVASSIRGLISGRLDRLEESTKRILQEASVIGRAFLFEILAQITEIRHMAEFSLSELERFDLIRTRSFQPYLEYVFKHVLTQEVAYHTLLKKERHDIHERIGIVIEDLFRDRLSEFSETLAFHFTKGRSINKAVDYLIMSGEKSLEKYSLDESDKYFREAYNILSERSNQIESVEKALIKLLLKWSIVFHWRGAYKELIEVLKAHEKLAESFADKGKLAMFYAYLGLAFNCIEELGDSFQYLIKALRLGEEIKNDRVTGYACARLARTCADLGLLYDAIAYGKRAQNIATLHKSDQELFLASCVGLGMAYFFKGECKKTDEVGKILLQYGQTRSENRLIAQGYQIIGWGRQAAGDFNSSIEYYQKAVKTSVDPMITFTAKFVLGISYLSDGQLEEAERTLEDVVRFGENWGLFGPTIRMSYAVLQLAKANLGKGVRIVKDLREDFLKNQRRSRYIIAENMLGQIYLRTFLGEGEKSFSFLVRNFGFLVKNVLFAYKKAEGHYDKAIKVSKEIGANSLLGQAYLGKARLYKAKRRNEQARKYLTETVKLLENCEADAFLKQAREEMKSL